MFASKGINIPGGWGKDVPAHASYEDIEDVSEQDLATGIVDEAGNVVNTTGKTVGKITEGKPDELVGDVVTATGDILTKSGDIVGKAVPLGGSSSQSEDGDDIPKKGGWTILGTVKSVGGLVETVDSTAQTVTKPVTGLVGGVTKGLGLGGDSESKKKEDTPVKEAEKPTETLESATKEADKPAETLESTTEEAGEKAPEAPIDLEDKEPELKDKDSSVPTDTPATSKDEGLKDIDNPEDFVVDDKPTDKVDDAVEAPTEKVDETVEEPKEKIDETVEEPKEKVDDAVEESKAKADDTVEEPTEKVDDAVAEPKDKLDDTVSETKDKAEDAVDETASKVDEAKSTAEEEVPVAPFERFDNPIVGEDGRIMADDQSIGRIIEGEAKDLEGKQVDAEGNIIDPESGSILGKAELKTEFADEAEDWAALKGAKANKLGNVVNEKGEVVGRIVEGIQKNLIGKKCDEKGQFWNDAGKVIGRAEPIPENERTEYKEPAPFEDFPDATVQSNGDVVWNGEVIGKVVEGDPKALKGKKVDDDGDILDKSGNTLGRAERWEAPEAEPEAPKDNSILAGKRVNKAGNVVDSNGQIFGRVIEGDVKRLVGRMCDKEGNVRSESGDVLGKAEVVPEGEREGFKDGPFAELQGCTVAKDGKVVTPAGDVVGRLIKGDGKVLLGRAVDDDGDILDRNGNSIGKAERWDEPEVEKKKGPMAGRKINREGNVVDEDGNLIGKLTTGELSICSGKEIDDDGDVVDSKGRTIGHASLLSEIPPEPEPTESEEDKQKREQAEEDKKLAQRLAASIEQTLDKIRPICKMITQKIDKAERTPKEDLDEEDLVKQVKPLIEEGGRILNEANGAIRGLDPDGRIQAKAKHNSASREATPEEYHLADVLKELTGTVSQCIDDAKRKIEDMPHAKKELNPLWGLLTEPLFQILAAVGLLLNGVLALVGRLLSGLGLGGLVDNLLGGLGIKRILESLGVGGLTDALTGKKKGKK